MTFMNKLAIKGFLFLFPCICFAQSTKRLSLSDAIILAVENNYDIQKQQYAVASARGQYHQAAGALDVELGAQAQYSMRQNPVDQKDPRYAYSFSSLQPKTSYGIYSDNTLSHQTGGSLFAKKLFSFGLETKLSYTLQRNHDFPDYTYGANFNSALYSKYAQERGRNTGQIALELTLPLFKSFKNSMANLQIEAAKENLEAMECSLNDAISQAIINVSKQYWNYYQTFKNVERITEMQKKIEERNNRMDSLIKAGIRSKNDLLAMQVNVNENRRQLQDAQVQYRQAKMELLTVLGITDHNAIGDPDDPFKTVNLREIVPPSATDMNEEFFAYIEEHRSDLRSLKKHSEALQKKMKMADADRFPDVNLNFGVGTTGTTYSDEFLKAITAGFWNNAGVNINGAISVSAKIGNNAKTGAWEQAEAEYNQSLTDYNKAKNTLVLQINNATDKLNIYRAEYSDADEVLDLQKNLYDNEQQRFNAGLITIDNLLQQDQKFIAAEASYYQVLVNYLQAILEYKYYTSSLVEVDTTSAFEAKDLYTKSAEREPEEESKKENN